MQHETLVVSGEFDTVDHLLAAAAAQQGSATRTSVPTIG